MDLAEKIRNHVSNGAINVIGIRHHLKASESYVDVQFKYDGGVWEGSVPYQYRRTGLFLEDPKLIAEMLEVVYENTEPKKASEWVKLERAFWDKNGAGKLVTKEFFYKMLNLQWGCIEHDFPPNPNWARRIQDIKEMGYTLATDTRRICKKTGKSSSHILLLPLERTAQSGYEYISPKLRERVIKLLNGCDSYEASQRQTRYLIPDHKFPEISWDAETRKENLDNLTDEEIIEKFQLLDNQRNLQKRESCRKTFQTGIRGTIFGIKYFYEGDENWPNDVPKVGNASEKGWIGSPWYDIERWRKSLNSKLEAVRKLELLLGHSLEEELRKRNRGS